MKRREFVTLLGATAMASPFAAHAQQRAMRVIGLLSSLSGPIINSRIELLARGLSETGYVLKRDVSIEVRTADGQYDRLPALAADLVARRVDLIATLGPPAAHAAKAATRAIPIVFVTASDAVSGGLVSNLSRPGGNITGISFSGATLGAKRLELIRELIPNARLIALLINPTSDDGRQELGVVRAAARAIGQELLVLEASRDSELDSAFATIVQHGAGAVLVGADPFFSQHTDRLIALAARHRIPAVYQTSRFVRAGGLISYGGNDAEAWRLAGVYAGRILNGANPAELPVIEPSTFVTAINLRTAQKLGIAIPPAMLARFDETIE